MKNLELSKYILISSLVHLALFLFFTIQQLQIKKNITYTVELVPEFQFQKRQNQLVSPSNLESKVAPKTASFKSDKNSAVEKESIKRGDPLAGIPGAAGGKVNSNPVQASQASKASEQMKSPETTKSQATKLEKAKPENIKPANNDMIREMKKTAPKKLDLRPASQLLNQLLDKQINNQKSQDSNQQDPKPFSRAAGTGAKFYGFAGSSDFLPNIQDGDLTLLNAKADKFSVFVRRVAVRVFQLLKQSGWEKLTGQEINSLRDWTYIKASMNLKGELLAIDMLGTSGSLKFDSVTKDSIAKGVPDPNPPAEAIAADGNIRFIFLARSWSNSSSNSASARGGMFEQRWLMLKTGLE